MNPTILAASIFIFLIIGTLWSSRRADGYSHIRHTISELGEWGSPQSRLVSWGLFAPVGIGLLVLAGLVRSQGGAHPLAETLTLLIAAVGIGYLGAAIFPCDPGSPMGGSWRQQLHNLAGGVQYVGGAGALFVASQSLTANESTLVDWLLVSGVVVGVVAVLLSIQQVFPVRGVVQRVGEIVLFGNIVWLVFVGSL
ncbi:DUF998 domain-containing protein [bacterium]|nr:DUF998 domain-containing protein [bacterium]